jgi:hypothetical protein
LLSRKGSGSASPDGERALFRADEARTRSRLGRRADGADFHFGFGRRGLPLSPPPLQLAPQAERGYRLMAADLATTPTSGIRVQACGDAHLMNFGGFATPERNVIFDVNDLDETPPAPFE